MQKTVAFIFLLYLGGFAPGLGANDQTAGIQWDRGSAMAVVHSVDIDLAVLAIGDVSTLADGAATLRNLKNLETRNDWPLPAREAAIYQFTRSLAGLPRDAVAKEVMQHLRSFQAQTLVPDEDHGDVSVPLFNIRGAAAGVENGWQRAEFTGEAIALLETRPAMLVSGFLESRNRNQRAGYLDALRLADLTAVMSVHNTALEQLQSQPGLTPLVGATTLINPDTFAIQQLLSHGSGAGLSPVLVQLEQRLPLSETAVLLAYAIENTPATNAALAIAAWWPRLRHDAASRDLLVDTLADPALGAAAALALAHKPDIQTIKVLQDTASGDSPAARRAQMSLDLNRDGLSAGGQP